MAEGCEALVWVYIRVDEKPNKGINGRPNVKNASWEEVTVPYPIIALVTVAFNAFLIPFTAQRKTRLGNGSDCWFIEGRSAIKLYQYG